MTEFVVQLDVTDPGDTERLTSALDALADWCDDLGSDMLSDDQPEFMMTTVHTGHCLRRRLIFRSQEQASKFMTFWRGQPGD